MNRVLRYRLNPTLDQQYFFHNTFGSCRKIWNLMLSDKIESYRRSGTFCKVNPALYKDAHPYLRDVDSLALCNTWKNLEQAFKNCFDKKRKKRNGFPHFKSKKHSKNSYTTNNQHGTVRVTNSSIKLPKIGYVKAVIHKKPDDDWVLRSVTISMESDGRFYASVLFQVDAKSVSYQVNKNNAIGLDYASDGLYVDSNGCKGSNHKYYRESHKKLAKAQQRLSKKVGSRKGEQRSNNYQKQLLRVNRIHIKIRNQRKDHLQKISNAIAKQYDIVCVESLNMRSMANKGFGNGKATLDNGYGMFLNMLDYKLSDRGKLLIKVDKWYPSSQLCSCCGFRNPVLKDLKIRRWTCPSCNVVHERDMNAAINIRNEGLRLLSMVT